MCIAPSLLAFSNSKLYIVLAFHIGSGVCTEDITSASSSSVLSTHPPEWPNSHTAPSPSSSSPHPCNTNAHFFSTLHMSTTSYIMRENATSHLTNSTLYISLVNHYCISFIWIVGVEVGGAIYIHWNQCSVQCALCSALFNALTCAWCPIV